MHILFGDGLKFVIDVPEQIVLCPVGRFQEKHHVLPHPWTGIQDGFGIVDARFQDNVPVIGVLCQMLQIKSVVLDHREGVLDRRGVELDTIDDIALADALLFEIHF